MGSCAVKGQEVRVHYETVEVKNSVVGQFIKCVPSYRYRGYPNTVKKPAFSLLLEKLAVRPKLNVNPMKNDYDSYNWWADAQFLPNNDTVLLVSGELMGAAGPVYGNIMAISLDKDNNGVHLFARTHLPVDTKFHVHPSGACVAYASFKQCAMMHITIKGICNISFQNPIVLTNNEETISTRHDIEPNGSDRGFTDICREIAFAPDGQQLAKIVIRIKMAKETVVLSVVEKRLKSSTVRSVELKDKFRFVSFGFGLHRNKTFSLKQIECKWTPDSKHIAVSCAIYLCIFNRRLEQVFDISETLRYEPEHYIGEKFGIPKFDFDPTSCDEMLAFGTVDRRVCFINSHTKQMDAQTLQLSCREDFIDCLQYHPFGKYVVVGTRNFTIYFVDPRNGTVLHSFDMHTECPDLRQVRAIGQSIMCIAFSAAGEQLVTATCDGKVRVYQMPVEISLFDKCKWVILSAVSQTKLQSLPLPNPVINKLLAIPVMK